MTKLFTSLIFLSAAHVGLSLSLRGGIFGHSRQLQSTYYTTSDPTILGAENPDAAVGNPMKGLMTSPRWTGFNTPDTVPSTLEFYYFGFDEVMTGPNQFDWTVMDESLESAAASNKHVIWRIFCHYPKKPLRLPQFLIDSVELVQIGGDEKSPQYDDPVLLEAFRQFIFAWGERYDGNPSLAAIQLGLLGKWGEWHTYPEKGLLSEETKTTVLGWFDESFQQTQLQSRDPSATAAQLGIGLHDDSFGFSTLDGPPNGGTVVDWFFWPKVTLAGQTESWKTSMMGGETRPELQTEIFLPNYDAGTEYKQDFMECVGVTHATYMLHNRAFKSDNPLNGVELQNHLHAHARLGYNYRVSQVSATAPGTGNTILVEITVDQIGVSPFYYPLNLVLNCDGTTEAVGGVEDIIAPGDSKVFRFSSVPADAQCLENIEITLDSEYLYPGRPMKFAQGNDGKVIFSLPLPPSEEDPVVEDPEDEDNQDEGSEQDEDEDQTEEDPIIDDTEDETDEDPSIDDTEDDPDEDPVVDDTEGDDENDEDEIFVDAGPEDEDISIVTGDFWQNFADVPIANTGKYGEAVFQTHRWGSDFSYTFDGLTPGAIKEVKVGFAETYSAACTTGGRVMDIDVNDQEFVSELDVFTAAGGCQAAYVLAGDFAVNDQGELVINFLGSMQNAMVSFIKIEDSQDGDRSGQEDESTKSGEDANENSADKTEGHDEPDIDDETLLQKLWEFIMWLLSTFSF